jgi:hypothetical protein
MAYLSKAQRARQKWMTLKEALSHIQRFGKLDENAALQQLRLALAEGAVCASWAMTEARLQKTGDSPTIGIQIVDDSVRDRFWLDVRINLEVGRLEFETHDVIDEDKPPYSPGPATTRVVQSDRVVWVLKDSIFKIWKDEELKEAIIEPPTDHEGPIVEHPKDGALGKGKKRKSKATQEEILSALRKFFKEVDEGRRAQPKEATIKEQIEFELQKEITRKDFEKAFLTPEFEIYQRGRGRPRKK